MYITQAIEQLDDNQQNCQNTAKERLLEDYNNLMIELRELKEVYQVRSKRRRFIELSSCKYQALEALENRLVDEGSDAVMNPHIEASSVYDIILEIDHNYSRWREGFVSHKVDDFVEKLLKFEENLPRTYITYLAEVTMDEGSAFFKLNDL